MPTSGSSSRSCTTVGRVAACVPAFGAVLCASLAPHPAANPTAPIISSALALLLTTARLTLLGAAYCRFDPVAADQVLKRLDERPDGGHAHAPLGADRLDPGLRGERRALVLALVDPIGDKHPRRAAPAPA